ncbi:MAG: hypothetical protein JWO38_4779 [Gemmataceae bacterium]|nr:hypothetical protein [Gemmataceae bacterium]
MSAITGQTVVYPSSDGKRMADDTLQFQWITTIQGNLDLLFRNDPTVFVAGDNLVYPVEREPGICQAPDIYVVFGREKGHRSSYRVWEEGIFPQVVFEILSPSNTAHEMNGKRHFYNRYGAEEYYIYDPEDPTFEAWTRTEGRLRPVQEPNGFVSPRLGVRFDTSGTELVLTGPDGRRFLAFVELGALQRQTEQRAERLAARLRELGVDPDTL